MNVVMRGLSKAPAGDLRTQSSPISACDGRRLLALFALLANLVGTRVGPIAVGAISYLARRGQLPFAMKVMLGVNVLAVLTMIWAGRALGRWRAGSAVKPSGTLVKRRQL
jgi:hypothetical protein